MSIDLSVFCGDNDGRFALAEPWVFDGWRYATDGAICVRVPAPGEADTEPVRLSSLERLCHPNGSVPEFFLSFPECKSLLPKLRWVRPLLNGPKIPRNLQIGDRLIDGRYLELIATLPDVRICPDGSAGSPMAFVSGELQGVVMPRMP